MRNQLAAFCKRVATHFLALFAKAKAEKLREKKKGLMQELLTGKVRLKIKG
jgi:hypothetical protein